MSYTIEYHIQVQKEDIPGLPKKIKTLIQSRIKDRLLEHPEIYGKPLRKDLKNYRKLRIGDYRIVFKIVGQKIRILTIDHRSRIYQKAVERLNHSYF